MLTIDKLSYKSHVTVILRLVVDRRGVLEHGEIVGVEARPQVHFKGWRALTYAIRAYLADLEQDTS